MVSKQQNSASPEVTDQGAGYVVIALDHGTGGVRVGYDNVTPEQMLAMANTLRGVAESLLKEQERQRVGEEVRRELEAERQKLSARRRSDV